MKTVVQKPVVLLVASLTWAIGSYGYAQDSLDRFIQPRKPIRQRLQQPVQPSQFEAMLPPRSSSPSPRIRQLTTPQYRATVKQHHSQLVIADQKISRIAVTAPDIVNFVQYSETEVALIGLKVGSTDLTIWFEGSVEPVMYEITVVSGAPKASSPHAAISEVGMKLRTVFPRSRIQLIPVADQIVVKGQAWDAAEAKQIMQILEAQFAREQASVVNMLRVPGEFQVMMRVRIAELNRTQLRRLGVNSRDLLTRSRKSKSFGPTTAGVSGVFDNREVDRMMRWLTSNGTISYLAEPSLTVLSGHSASFLSGGEYAVPTVVRDGEKQTQFRDYGTKLKVTPTIVDRDLIRINIAPEFSQIDEKHAVDGVPATNVRRLETVVELREGQTIAIGGLISRQMQTEVSRKPSLRPRWFSRRATEADTELLIVVTPEIVRPMDPSEVPPMPNYYVTHPSDTELFGEGRSEGSPVATRIATAPIQVAPPTGGMPVVTETFSFSTPMEVNRPASILPVPNFNSMPPAASMQNQPYLVPTEPQSIVPSQSQPAQSSVLPPQPMQTNPALGGPPVPPDSSQGQPLFDAPSPDQGSGAGPLFDLPIGRDTPMSQPNLPPPTQSDTDKPAHVYPDSVSIEPPSQPVTGSVFRRQERLSVSTPLPPSPGISTVTHSVTQPRSQTGARAKRSAFQGGHSPILKMSREKPAAELPRLGHSLPKIQPK